MPSSSSEPNSTSSNNEPAVDNKKATKNADMVKMIQLKIDRLDPDEDAERINKLKKKMEVFK
jgi:hypothetical protein